MVPRDTGGLAEELRSALGRLNRALKAEGISNAEHPYARLNLSDLVVAELLVRQKTVIMSEVARALDSPLSTATTVVDRLVKAKLVARSRAESDRRSVQLTLTAEGRRLAALLKRQQLKSSQIMLAALSPPEQREFLTLFERMIVAAERALLPHPKK
jgi:DNA-binding MarR family transcriptional regulator